MRFKVCKIPLRRRDGSVRAYTLVSPDDYESVARHRWHWFEGYAIRRAAGQNSKVLFIHRELLGISQADWKQIQVDHINRDRLDNRRENLRLVTINQQRQNVTPWASSGYRGVYFHKASGLWRAIVRVDGKQHSFGYHKTPEKAAEAAECGRAELHGYATD